MLQVNSLFSKSKNVYILAFFTPVLILTIIMLCSLVYPLGDNCILKTDMYHQYAPFFSEFREKLQNGGSLKFTWDLGMGVNFAAIMAYYLASPFNWLIYFVGENYVIEFMTVMIVLKAGLSAVAMAVYFRYKAPEENFGAYLFSIFYALSGYFCAYYWNIMWMDTIAVFPLVMLGTEKIIKGESGVLYAAALGYGILCNYYISIMVCIFLVFYFFACSVLEGYDSVASFFKTGIRFAFWSLLAGALSAVMLLPEIYALGATASSGSTFPKTVTQYFTIFDMLARHMACVQTEQWLKHYPNIFCGTAVYVLIPLYLMSKRISVKEKAVYVVLAIFMLAGFSINVLNFLWHGYRFPNSLPARQSFIYCFLIIVMCFRIYQERDGITKREIGISLAVASAFILMAQKLITDNDEFHFVVFYVALLLVALYAGIIHLYRRGELQTKTVGILLMLLVLVELSANTAATSFTTTSRSAYMKNNTEIRNLVGNLEDGLYRIERVERKTKDDGAWLNFHAVSIFSSMANKDCTDFFQNVGCEGSTNAYSITGSTPLVDMLFGVKYVLFSSEQDDLQGKKLHAQEGDAYLYENEYALPIGFALPQRVNSEWMLDMDNPMLVQNSLCDALSVGQVLVPVYTGSESSGKYTVTLSEDGEYYAFAGKAKAETITVNWPDHKKTFEHLDRRYVMELGQCKKGDLIKLTSEGGVDMDIHLYRFDYSVLADIYDKMSKYPLNVEEFSDDSIRGTIEVNTKDMGYSSGKAQMLITTPYDEGWKVSIDGKPVEIYKGLDTFVAFYIPDGKHEIEMHYVPRGSREGALISALSLLVIIGFGAFGIYQKRKKPKEEISLPENMNENNEEIEA